MKALLMFIGLAWCGCMSAAQPTKLWDKTIGGGITDRLNGLAVAGDSGFYIGGNSNSTFVTGDKSEAGWGSYDFWVVRVAADGKKVWDKTLGTESWDDMHALLLTPEGGVLAGGESSGPAMRSKTEEGRGGKDFWTIQLDPQGKSVRNKTYGGKADDVLTAMVATADGGYLLGGFSNSDVAFEKTEASRGYNDFWIVRVSGTGKKLWDKTIGGDGEDYLRAMLPMADGGFLLGGESKSGAGGDKTEAGRGRNDYWVVRVDSVGNKLWDKTFGGAEDDWLTAMTPTDGGGFLLGGSSKSPAGGERTDTLRGDYDFWVVRLDADGKKLWDKAYGGPKADDLYGMIAAPKSGFLLGGNSGLEGWMVRIDADGAQLWDRVWSSIGGFDYLVAMSTMPDDGYILGGVSAGDKGKDKSENGRGLQDFWLIRLGPDLTDAPRPEVTPAFTLFPNPAQDVLHLSNLSARNMQLSIVDVTGRLLLSQTVSGTSAEIDVQALPAGLYLLQIDGTSQRFVKQ